MKKEKKWHYKSVLWLVLALLACFLFWANSFEIERHVRAQGRIIPAGKAKIVQHLEGGIVNEILVAEGQKIEKGDVLMQVSNQRARSDLGEQKIAMEALKIRMARLRSVYAQEDTFSYTPEISTEKLKDLIDNERRIFKAQRQALEEKISILKEQKQQRKLRLEDLTLQLDNLRAERNVAQEKLEINERLKRSGAISESRYLDSKSQVRSFDTRIDQVKKTIPITQAEIQEIQQKIGSEREEFKAKITDEISQVELGIQKLYERMKAGYDEVSRTDVLSPARGIINKLHVNTKGGVVQPGQPLVEIIPLDENLIVEARVLTNDRGLIWIGLPAMIKVTAYDYAIYGGVKGEVIDISADSFTDERGVQYYRTRIMLEKNIVADDQPLYPGMTIEANIISGKIKILYALLKPFWRIRENALREP